MGGVLGVNTSRRVGSLWCPYVVCSLGVGRLSSGSNGSKWSKTVGAGEAGSSAGSHHVEW